MGTTTLKGEVDSDGFTVNSPGRLSGTCLRWHAGNHTLGILQLIAATRAVSAARGRASASVELVGGCKSALLARI